MGKGKIKARPSKPKPSKPAGERFKPSEVSVTPLGGDTDIDVQDNARLERKEKIRQDLINVDESGLKAYIAWIKKRNWDEEKKEKALAWANKFKTIIAFANKSHPALRVSAEGS